MISKTGKVRPAPVAAPKAHRPDEMNGGIPPLPPEWRAKLVAKAAEHLGVPASKVEVKRLEGRMFPDSGLGLAGGDEAVLMVVVPGWRVTVRAGDSEAVFHVGMGDVRLNPHPERQIGWA